MAAMVLVDSGVTVTLDQYATMGQVFVKFREKVVYIRHTVFHK